MSATHIVPLEGIPHYSHCSADSVVVLDDDSVVRVVCVVLFVVPFVIDMIGLVGLPTPAGSRVTEMRVAVPSACVVDVVSGAVELLGCHDALPAGAEYTCL